MASTEAPASATRSDSNEPGQPVQLTGRDVRRLIWATYGTSLPYLLVFLLLFGGAVWLVTEVIFR